MANLEDKIDSSDEVDSDTAVSKIPVPSTWENIHTDAAYHVVGIVEKGLSKVVVLSDGKRWGAVDFLRHNKLVSAN